MHSMNNGLELLHQRLEQLEARCARSERRLRAVCGLGVASLMVALFASPASRAVAQSGYGATIQSLINKTQYLTVANGEMFISGTNLHLVNGMGSTGTTNALGNLILGYNGSRVPFDVDVRTGSHNLILGDLENYSSSGGIVAGFNNAISGAYASVTGGQGNTASGFASSVSGGYSNTASGGLSSVSGGRANTAGGDYSSVSGGDSNAASGTRSSVSGGGGNEASGDRSSVSGGLSNEASGFLSSVSGGFIHIQNGQYIWQGGPYSGQ
jgi:hypothetical protein